MAIDVLRIGLILVASRLLLACVCVFHNQCGESPELSRKLLHLAMGALAMTYPWIFRSAWPVLTLSGIYLLLLWGTDRAETLRRRVGVVIRGVRRTSSGEYYFPVVTAILFVIADGNAVLYCVPLLLLTLADAAAAIVGEHYGRHRYRVLGQTKSLEGSAAFFAVALLITFVALFRVASPPTVLAMTLAIAVITTLAEALSSHGADNLFVPLTAFTLLKAFPGSPLG